MTRDKELLEMLEAAAEYLGDISELIIDKFVAGCVWVVNILFLHEKKYRHQMDLTKEAQIKIKRMIGMIIPYEPKH